MDEVVNSLKTFIDYDEKAHKLLMEKPSAIVKASFNRLRSFFKKELARVLQLKSYLIGMLKLSKKVSTIPNSGVSLFKKKVEELYEDYKEGYGKEINDYFAGKKTTFDVISNSLAFLKFIKDLRTDFERKVADKMIAYYIYINEDFNKLVNKAVSFNELLHLIHSYSLVTVKGVESKKIDEVNIKFIGEQDSLSKRLVELFTKYKKELTDWDLLIYSVTIISFKEFKGLKVLIIRDIGHSTVIKIRKVDDDIVKIFYSIPKAFGKKQVSELGKFVRSHPNGFHVFDSKNYVSGGYFELKKGLFSNFDKIIVDTVFELLKRMPTDFTYFKDDKRVTHQQ